MIIAKGAISLYETMFNVNTRIRVLCLRVVFEVRLNRFERKKYIPSLFLKYPQANYLLKNSKQYNFFYVYLNASKELAKIEQHNDKH